MKVLLSKVSLIFPLLLTSCFLAPKCEDYKASFLSKKANLVIQKNVSVGRQIDLKGYEPVSLKEANYYDGGGFYINMIEAIELRDTLVKNGSETKFLLKKKSFNLKFEQRCDGEEYLKLKADTLSKKSFDWVKSQ